MKTADDELLRAYQELASRVSDGVTCVADKTCTADHALIMAQLQVGRIRKIELGAITLAAEITSHSRSQQSPGWRDIATAPKDGTLILTTCREWPRPVVLAWTRVYGPTAQNPINPSKDGVGTDYCEWSDGSGDGDQDYRPTLWLPIPPRPAPFARFGLMPTH